MARFSLAVLLLLSCFVPASAQERVDPRNTYERIIVIAPISGSGKSGDHKRPVCIPAGEALSRSGILGFASVVSDDGKYALIELVARDRSAFKQIYSEKRGDVKIFQKGRAKKEDIEKEFRKYKRDFDLDQIVVVLP